MFGLSKVLSFKYVSTYNEARILTDGIIVSFIKSQRNLVPENRSSYTSTITKTIRSRLYWSFNKSYKYNPINDDKFERLQYKITIFKCIGNRGSLLSISQNKIFDVVIDTNNLEEILERMNSLKSK